MEVHTRYESLVLRGWWGVDADSGLEVAQVQGAVGVGGEQAGVGGETARGEVMYRCAGMQQRGSGVGGVQ